MALLSSSVPRALETKTKLFGFELADVLLVFLYLAATDFLFGRTFLKGPVVWGGTTALCAGLYFLKRGKPDDHLRHALQWWLLPGSFSAGERDLDFVPYEEIST